MRGRANPSSGSGFRWPGVGADLGWTGMRTLPGETEMFRALLRRDESYEGVFVVGVRTTGIFCRPSCPARKPRRENVEFFPTTDEAQRAGYRPCRRCTPLEAAGSHPAWATRLIDELERHPERRIKDADLRARGVEPERARRYFRGRFGMTFQAYQRTHGLGVALGQLNRAGGPGAAGKTVEGLGAAVGFESSSGFREAFGRLFGEPPGRARDHRAVLATLLFSPLGPLVAAASEDGVCMLEFADRKGLKGQAAALGRATSRAVVPGRNDHLERLAVELAEYFDGRRERFEVPLDAPGTDFQRSVWAHLLTIPYGVTRSYEDVARALGRDGAQRAVGRANGQNRLSILIPCHRVVQKNGALRGYGGGLWRKRWLLELEGRGRARSTGSPLRTDLSRPV